MASPNIGQQNTPPVIPEVTGEGKITKKVKNPISGKEEKMVGTFTLPIAKTLQEVESITKGNEEELLFWFNYGRKAAARQHVNNMLALDFGSEELNERYDQYQAAIKQLNDDSMTEEEKKVNSDFILKGKKFQALAEKLNSLKESLDPISVDFSTTEIRKPTGVRGRVPGQKSEEAESED